MKTSLKKHIEAKAEFTNAIRRETEKYFRAMIAIGTKDAEQLAMAALMAGGEALTDALDVFCDWNNLSTSEIIEKAQKRMDMENRP